MDNRRLALLVSLCAVLFAFAVAKNPGLTNAKVRLTETPTPSEISIATSSSIVPSPNSTSIMTPTVICPTYYLFESDAQAHIPNSSPTRTPVPTPNIDPCYVHPTLFLNGPSQVNVGELFTLSITYENIGMQHTRIWFNDANLARFDPPLVMPCQYDRHPTRCERITLRATSVGTLVINADARGESFHYGWYWSSAAARTPLTINVIDPNGTPVPTPTCVPATLTPTSTAQPTYTPTVVGQRVPDLTETPTPSSTSTITPVPCQPAVSHQLILNAPSQVQVGDMFTMTVDYQNMSAPRMEIMLSSSELAQFDPPLTMPCRYSEHPTQCSTITLRATAPGMLTINGRAIADMFVGDGWTFGYTSARNPINVQVHDGLPYKLFIPLAKNQ
ncbi:MAG TPA: hypothetical protein DEF47_21410 [Herpetosiphon sp.]|uniref:Uncharacterized protein n=2 Tax=Herpetosiphon TaxID=64 RepID=A9B174_HERA2|nr:hypothetical protein Haur_2714 [Herpetosiphon aurantiacus DSM 785]HBW52450.1 hypothetical protein [Herpetosiphon sp.]